MYVGIDVGGTKTLVAVLSDGGEIVEKHKFPTAKDYDEQLAGLRGAFDSFEQRQFTAGAAGIPGRIDRKHGVSLGSPNVTWANQPVQADCEKIFGCPFAVENDANLAGLSEAMLHKEYETVLYFTISTGIGTGVVRGQRLDPGFLDMEGGHLVLPYEGTLTDWEDFASGRMIYQRYGKPASEINDETAWKSIAHNLGLGFFNNIAIVQPDLIVVGGGVGTYFDHYGKYLTAELKQYEIPLVPIPPIVGAQRAEEAVIYGCYDLAKQQHGGL
ncbi:MAG TPA: ROK family protein [Candidatus Saccharimonadales bacterium]